MKRAYINIPMGQIHYRIDGRGEVLILLHQATLASDEYSEMIPLLADKFQVIAPDIPGHGNSVKPPSNCSNGVCS